MRIVPVLVALAALLAVPAGAAGPAPGAAPTPAAVAARAPQRPNILLVVADDMRTDDLRFTPRLRRLVAREGVDLRNGFSSFPLCCPARASLLTGVQAHTHDVLWHEPPYAYGAFDDSRTLGTALQGAGYRTAYVGKYLNRYGRDTSRVSGGPSHRWAPPGWDRWRATLDSAPGRTGGTYQYFRTLVSIDGRPSERWYGDYSTDVLGDLTLDALRDFSARDRPFFVMANFLAPHGGGGPKRSPREVRLPDGSVAEYGAPAPPPYRTGRFDADREVVRGAGIARSAPRSERDRSDKPATVRRIPPLTRADLRALTLVTRDRADALWALDRQVDRLVRQLRRSGEWDRTVLLVTSDNGLLLGEHGIRMGKVRGYEPSLRVPLLAVGGPVTARGDRFDPATLVDLHATVLDLAGAQPPYPTEGRSFGHLLTGPDRGWTDAVLVESSIGKRADGDGYLADGRTTVGVRTARWTYIRHDGGDRELYDLVADPFQDEDVARDPAYAEVRRQLQAVVDRLRDCRGTDCVVPLPAELAAGPEETARWTRGYWRAVDERYGY